MRTPLLEILREMPDQVGQSSAHASEGQPAGLAPKSLDLGSAGRKPRDCAQSVTEGRRNRHETRRLEVFDAKAWFARTPWEPLIKTVLRLKRIVHRRDAATGFWTTSRETVFWVSSAEGFSAQLWNAWVRGHWRIENGSHYVRDATFAEDASRIRKNPDIAARLRSFAYNLLRATRQAKTSKTPDGAPRSISTSCSISSLKY